MTRRLGMTGAVGFIDRRVVAGVAAGDRVPRAYGSRLLADQCCSRSHPIASDAPPARSGARSR
jgi:hypothetical protein